MDAMCVRFMSFFAFGFETSVVNLFLIPSEMMLGAPFSGGQWFFWNLLPVTIGNFFAGTLLPGMALYATYPAPAAPAANHVQVSTTLQDGHQAAFADAGLH